MNHNLLNTKTVVPRKDVRSFEKQLFKQGFRYPLNLDLSQYPRYKKNPNNSIAFIINCNGEIENIDYETNFHDFNRSSADNINWEFYFE